MLKSLFFGGAKIHFFLYHSVTQIFFYFRHEKSRSKAAPFYVCLAFLFPGVYRSGVNSGFLLLCLNLFLGHQRAFVFLIDVVEILNVSRRQHGFEFLVEGCLQVENVLAEFEFLVLKVGELLVGKLCDDLFVLAGLVQTDALLGQILFVGFVQFDFVTEELVVC